jgi:hypothetical protein
VQRVQLLIGGRDVDAANGATFVRLNPMNALDHHPDDASTLPVLSRRR